MQQFHGSVTEVARHINFLIKTFNLFCEYQDGINLCFNRLWSGWKDKLFRRTGYTLNGTSREIVNCFDRMKPSLISEKEELIKLCRYNDQSESIPDAVLTQPSNSINTEDTMSDGLEMIDPEVIKKFKNDLDAYIDNVSTTLSKLLSEHDAMSASWKDDNYRKLTDELTNFSAEIRKQLSMLSILSELIKRKIAILEE